MVDVNRVPIVVVKTTREYRACVSRFCSSKDHVLEIGCAQAITTDIMSKYVARAVGFDKAEKEIELAKERFPHLELFVIDGFDIPTVRL
jgi:hypothetical protein